VGICVGLQVTGVGFTGSLASSRPKHGDHRYASSLDRSINLDYKQDGDGNNHKF
jgi:hypothetical protein